MANEKEQQKLKDDLSKIAPCLGFFEMAIKDGQQKLADEFSQIAPYLSGYIEQDRKTLEHRKKLLNDARQMLKHSDVPQHQIESMVQGANNMAQSYFGIGRSEYGELRVGALAAMEFLVHLYNLGLERAPIIRALELICDGFERRGDIEGLSKLQEFAESNANWILAQKSGVHYHSLLCMGKYETPSVMLSGYSSEERAASLKRTEAIREKAQQKLAQINERYNKLRTLSGRISTIKERIASKNAEEGSGKLSDEDKLGPKKLCRKSQPEFLKEGGVPAVTPRRRMPL